MGTREFQKATYYFDRCLANRKKLVDGNPSEQNLAELSRIYHLMAEMNRRAHENRLSVQYADKAVETAARLNKDFLNESNTQIYTMCVDVQDKARTAARGIGKNEEDALAVLVKTLEQAEVELRALVDTCKQKKSYKDRRKLHDAMKKLGVPALVGFEEAQIKLENADFGGREAVLLGHVKNSRENVEHILASAYLGLW